MAFENTLRAIRLARYVRGKIWRGKNIAQAGNKDNASVLVLVSSDLIVICVHFCLKQGWARTFSKRSFLTSLHYGQRFQMYASAMKTSTSSIILVQMRGKNASKNIYLQLKGHYRERGQSY